MIVDELLLEQLSITARATFLQYKVLTKYLNLELDFVKSKLTNNEKSILKVF